MNARNLRRLGAASLAFLALAACATRPMGTHSDPSFLRGLIDGLLAPITFIHSNVGLVLGLKAFPAAVLGGFGSIPGALVGGILIGVIESMAGFYLPAGWKDVAPYIVLLAVLLLKPEGLFGLHARKKV